MSEILVRIMGILERVRNMSELSGIATAVFGMIFIFGLLNCILGYRILRFWMMLFGFAIGAGIGLFGAFLSGTEDKSKYLIVMVILGIALAVISFLIYRAGIFVIGTGIGLSLSTYILHPTTSAVFFLCILAGVGLGCLAMRYAREVIIVGTSLFGGVMAGFSLGKIGELPQIPYGIMLSVGFAALGMLLQFLINKPVYEEEEPKKLKEKHYDDMEMEEDENFIDEDDFFEKTQIYEPESVKAQRRSNMRRRKEMER